MFFRFLSSLFTFVFVFSQSVTVLYSMQDETKSYSTAITRPYLLDNPRTTSRIAYILNTFTDHKDYYENKLYSLLSLGHSDRERRKILQTIYIWRLHPDLPPDEFQNNFNCVSLKTGHFDPLTMFGEYCKLSILAYSWLVIGR